MCRVGLGYSIALAPLFGLEFEASIYIVRVTALFAATGIGWEHGYLSCGSCATVTALGVLVTFGHFWALPAPLP